MYILAFDTSTTACSIALTNGEQIHQFHQVAPMQHTQLILPAIKSLLAEAGIGCDQIDAIAFGNGPGSFTGIRIASAIAQGLSFAHSIPLISISSLAALAQTAVAEHQLKEKSGPVLVAVDARMGEVYWGIYQVKAGLAVPIADMQRCIPDQIPIFLEQNCLAVGDGWQVYKSQLSQGLGFQPKLIQADLLPKAQSMLPLALEKFRQQAFINLEDAHPIYLN